MGLLISSINSNKIIFKTQNAEATTKTLEGYGQVARFFRAIIEYISSIVCCCCPMQPLLKVSLLKGKTVYLHPAQIKNCYKALKLEFPAKTRICQDNLSRFITVTIPQQQSESVKQTQQNDEEPKPNIQTTPPLQPNNQTSNSPSGPSLPLSDPTPPLIIDIPSSADISPIGSSSQTTPSTSTSTSTPSLPPKLNNPATQTPSTSLPSVSTVVSPSKPIAFTQPIVSPDPKKTTQVQSKPLLPLATEKLSLTVAPIRPKRADEHIPFAMRPNTFESEFEKHLIEYLQRNKIPVSTDKDSTVRILLETHNNRMQPAERLSILKEIDCDRPGDLCVSIGLTLYYPESAGKIKPYETVPKNLFFLACGKGYKILPCYDKDGNILCKFNHQMFARISAYLSQLRNPT